MKTAFIVLYDRNLGLHKLGPTEPKSEQSRATYPDGKTDMVTGWKSSCLARENTLNRQRQILDPTKMLEADIPP